MPCQPSDDDSEDRREFARDCIRHRVWSGHYDAGEVFDIVEEEVFDGDSEEETWLRRSIQREFEKKRQAERDWPRVTTCDRLEQVFTALRDQGILTQHRCGFTIQDGLDVIDDLYEVEGGKKSPYVGYCFYHLQDMERAMWSEGGLLLAFGSFSRSRQDGVAAGNVVRKAFTRAGFDVQWDGTIDSRILLEGFRWQRRSPEA